MITKNPFFSLLSVAIVALACAQCSKEEPVEKAEVSFVKPVKDWQFGKQALVHASKIVSFGTRPVESRELEMSRQYIQAEMKKRGWLVKRQAFTADTPEGRKQFVNLYARYQGKGESLEQVWQRSHHGVVGAHIDTKKVPGINYLGAVDAAGSVGCLIEMADFFAKHQAEKAAKLEIVFFDGEEAINKELLYSKSGFKDGLYGSHYYALHRNQVRKFGIILDLIGVEGQVIGVPNDSPPELVKTMRSVALSHGVADRFKVSENGITDDHIPLNIYGTPTIDLIATDFGESSSWWHKEGDTIELLSEKELGITLKVAIDMIAVELAR